MRELLLDDISALSEAYRSKRVSIVETVEAQLRRIERLQPTLNAYIRIAGEKAMVQAHVLDEELRRGQCRGPLHGVPIAVKDMIQTMGVATTAGSKILEHWIPDEDAAVVTKLKEAGAIVIGKANMHEFAMGATTENPHYGNARNPWKLEAISGGSSGGSAVAVAAGMSFAALGSDTAGSIRLPSAVCGIVGFKPTYGQVSRHGSVPFSWSLDHIGPMARTVRDAALLFDAIAGFDPKDPASAKHASLPVLPWIETELKGKTFAVCREYFFECIHPDIAMLIDQKLQLLRELGANVIELVLPGIAEAQQALKIIAQSEGYAFHKPMYSKHPELYGDDVRYRLEFGKNISAEQYLNAQRMRRTFTQQVLRSMQNVDAIVSPMNHNPPFAIGSVTPEQAINNMFHLAKAPIANLLGFPAITVPAGMTSNQLPAGIQLIGKPHADRKLLGIAQAVEQFDNGHLRMKQNRIYEL